MAEITAPIKIDHLVRSRRRSIALIIRPDATLEVRIPRLCPISFAQKFIEKKRNWIKTQQAFVHKKNAQIKSLKFCDGASFLHLGKTYNLQIGQYKNIHLDNTLNFPEKFLTHAKEYLTHWYKREAKKIISERVQYFSKITSLHSKKITITSAQKRWGSCSGRNTLCFSWRLILTPLDIIDYVIVHELSHIAEKNHSKKFWQKVEDIMPNYKQKRLWLKKNANSLTLL